MKGGHKLRALICGFLCVLAISNYHLLEEFQRILIEMPSVISIYTNRTAIVNHDVLTLENKSKVVVLVYTKFGKNEKWIQRPGSCYNKNNANSKECPLLQKFEITYNKTRFTESNFVMFEARDMPSLPHLKMLLKGRPMSQRWVFALWESPNHFNYTKPFHGLFNLTWTYRRDSDIWGPYGSYIQLNTEDPIYKNKKRPLKDFTQGKSMLVAWMVSNCRAKLRLKFVRELKKFIQVDVFGGCSDRIFGEWRSCPNTKQSKS